MFQISFTRSILGPLNLNGVLALAGIAGPPILVASNMTAALTSSWHYDFIKDSISSLAWTNLGWVQTMAFLALGLLVELFVGGLFFTIKGARGFGWGIIILAFFGFGLLLVGAFHTDPPGGPYTIDGWFHGIAAKVIFWFFPVAAALLVPSLKRDPNWKPLHLYTLIAAVFAIALILLWVVIREDMEWFGLWERLLVGDALIWVEVMSFWLLRLSLKLRTPVLEKPAAPVVL